MSIYDIYRPSYAVELEERIAALRAENERLRMVVEAARLVAEEAAAKDAPGQWDDYRAAPTKKQAALIAAFVVFDRDKCRNDDQT